MVPYIIADGDLAPKNPTETFISHDNDSDKGNRRYGPTRIPPLLQLLELSALKDVSGEESSRL